MPKLFESIVVEGMKPDIFSKMSKFQIGGCAGHRPQEHLFTVRSVIQLYAMLNIALILQCFDIKKYFDKEFLRDGMDALYQAEVNKKLYRLWFNLNKNTNIKVLSGVGLSEEKEVGECLGQGTL